MLDVDGKLDAAGAVALLEDLIDRVEHLDDFWNDLGKWWYKRQTDWFASGQIPLDAPSTTRRKGSAQPLVDTGALRESTRDNQPFNLGSGQATFGLRKGTPSWRKGALNLAGPRGAPERRAVAPLNQTDQVRVRDILRDHILEVVNR